LPNEELGPFSKNEDEILHNQPQKDCDEEVEHVSPLTTISPYYMPPHMHNVDLESNFQDFECCHTLDREKVQHPMRTFFEGMCFETKEKVQHVLQQYHVSKMPNYKT